jgi:hypothetical protein
MNAVTDVLKKTIVELQSLPSLTSFSLAGGTNLALRYNHRKSVDIDLFSSKILGFKGFDEIQREVSAYYGKAAQSFSTPCDISDQFVFMRFYIFKEGLAIKIELLQNMKNLYPIEIIDNVRLVSVIDIGIFKLISASNRNAKKDFYDLDYITEQISLIDLFNELKRKELAFNQTEDKTIFDLDGDVSCTRNPALLLSFDNFALNIKNRPKHSHDLIDIAEDGKSWASAKSTWRKKVRQLFTYLNLDFPNY